MSNVLESGIERYLGEVAAALEGQPEPQTTTDLRQRLDTIAEAFDIPLPDSVAVRDTWLVRQGHEVPVRSYRPSGDGPLPAVLYFHGGGWIGGSIASHEPIAAKLAELSGAAMFSVHYRRAPENPYPAPLDDCLSALAWARAEAESLGIDANRLAVAGDSAGGNLAAAVALADRGSGHPPLRFQSLLYPVVDTNMARGSYREASDPVLLPEHMRVFLEAYLGGRLDTDDPLAMPMRESDLSGLPPAYVVTVEGDPLRDEGEVYACRLTDAGVPVERHRVVGAIHGFLRAYQHSALAADEIARAAAALKRALTP